jgi:phage terminase large subunit
MALKNPGLRALMLRKTLSSFTSTGLVTWRQYVATQDLQVGLVEWYGGSSQEAAQYRYQNGSTITVGGMDKPTRIMSSEYDIIFVQEATELTETEWEMLTTRLRNGRVSFQQLIADCNPSTPTHWLKARANKGRTIMLESRHEDNPILFDEDGKVTERGMEYIEKLDALSGARHKRLRKGLWVSAEGVIYEDFDPAVHLIDSFPIPREWPRLWAIDFGFVNPFVCQWWAQDPDGRLYLYREIYMTKRLVEQHARDIMKQVTRTDQTWKEPKPRNLVTDHDIQARATLESQLGLSTTPADKRFSVSEGIQAVSSRLKLGKDGRPRIYIFRDALVERDTELADAKKPTSTVEEITGYIWAPTPDGKPQIEDPLKADDHGMDAMRYRVVQEDLGARPRVRWL